MKKIIAMAALAFSSMLAYACTSSAKQQDQAEAADARAKQQKSKPVER